MAGKRSDPALNLIMDIVLGSEREKRPVFSFLDEPVFYRRVRTWILEGFAERDKFQANLEKLKAG